MMKTFAKDSYGNVIVDPVTHDIRTVDGVEAYAIVIGDAIRTVRGELQLDTERGVPYFETVFKSVNGIDIWKNDVRKRVLEFPFVKSVDSFDVSYANRKLEYTMRLTTDAGDVTVTQ